MKPVVFTGHTRPIKDIVFNKEDDLLFTASTDRLVTLWSTETNERVGTYLHKAAVNCVLPTPDSKYLLTGDNMGFLSVWDVCTGESIKTLEFSVPRPITSLDLGVSDRDVLISLPKRGKDQESMAVKVNIEDIIKMPGEKIKDNEINIEKIPHTKIGEDADNKLMISRYLNANTQILSAFENGVIELRDIKTNSVLKKKLLHSTKGKDGNNEVGKEIMDLHLSCKEELALSSGKDMKSVLFDPETLDVIHEFCPDNPNRLINSGKISPLFNPDLPEKDQLYHCIIGGGQESKNVTFTKASEGGFEVLIYDMITGQEVGSITGHFSPVNAIAISNSGKIVVSGAEEATIRLHNMTSEYFNLKEY